MGTLEQHLQHAEDRENAIRRTLHISPTADVIKAVEVLYERGRASFEKMYPRFDWRVFEESHD